MQKLVRWHDVRVDKAIHFKEWPQEYGTESKEVPHFCSCLLQSKILLTLKLSKIKKEMLHKSKFVAICCFDWCLQVNVIREFALPF